MYFLHSASFGRKFPPYGGFVHEKDRIQSDYQQSNKFLCTLVFLLYLFLKHYLCGLPLCIFNFLNRNENPCLVIFSILPLITTSLHARLPDETAYLERTLFFPSHRKENTLPPKRKNIFAETSRTWVFPSSFPDWS